MNARRRRRRFDRLAGWLVPGLALAWLAPAVAVPATPERLAALVHLQGAPSAAMPASAAEIRSEALSVLAGLAGAQGQTLAERALTDDLVRRHRLRSDGVLTPEFLTDMRQQLGAPRLLAVTIVCEVQRVAVALRAVDAANGHLCAVGQSEAALGGRSWQAALGSALRQAFPALLAGSATGPELLILPARTVGVDPQSARAATGAILTEAVAGGAWAIIDPALAKGFTAAGGRDLGLLDGQGRELLRTRFGTDWAVVPELVSFGFAGAATGIADPTAADQPEGAARPAVDLTLSLQLLDLRTGCVRAAISIMVSGDPSRGWFGVVEPTTELDQVRHAAGELWARFQRVLQEQTS